MFDQQVGELRSVVADRFGDDLRSVAAYDEAGLDIRYMRPDVAELYDDRDHSRVFRTLRLEAMDRPTQDSLFSHGDLRCTYRVYEGATEIHVATSETRGVLVSVDADADVDLRSTTDSIIDVLGPVHSAAETNADGTEIGENDAAVGSETGESDRDGTEGGSETNRADR